MDYILKFGVITDSRHLPDDKHPEYGPNYYQVRVLPDMNDIEDVDPESGDLILPRYPAFFADDHHAYKPGETVWIVCDDDYHVGFIVGLASNPAGEPIARHVQMLNQAEQAAGLAPSGLNEVTINKVSEHCLTFVNESTGTVTQMYNTKTIYVYGADGSINITNGNLFNAVISPQGEISINGKSLTAIFDGDYNVKAVESLEDLASKNIETTAGFRVHTGGEIILSSGGNTLMRSAGDEEHVIVGHSNTTVGGGVSRTVLLPTVGVGIDDKVVAGDYNITVGAGFIKIVGGLGIKISSPVGITLTAPFVNITETGVNTVPIDFIQGFESGASVLSIPIPAIASPLLPLFVGFNLLDVVLGFATPEILNLLGGGLSSMFSHFQRDSTHVATIPYTVQAHLTTGLPTIKIKPTNGLVVGQSVTGEGIPMGTAISAITSSYELTLTRDVTQLYLNGNKASVSSVDVTFGPIKALCIVTANSTTITITSDSTYTSRIKSSNVLGLYIIDSTNNIMDGTQVTRVVDNYSFEITIPVITKAIPPVQIITETDKGIFDPNKYLTLAPPISTSSTYVLTFQSESLKMIADRLANLQSADHGNNGEGVDTSLDGAGTGDPNSSGGSPGGAEVQ